jgi:hypothetical protein
MNWTGARLNLNEPGSWVRRDDAEMLTFVLPGESELLISPLALPPALWGQFSGHTLQILLDGMVRQMKIVPLTLAAVKSCRFGLLATLAFKRPSLSNSRWHHSRLKLWLLANPTHALMVALSGESDTDVVEADTFVEAVGLLRIHEELN